MRVTWVILTLGKFSITQVVGSYTNRLFWNSLCLNGLGSCFFERHTFDIAHQAFSNGLSDILRMRELDSSPYAQAIVIQQQI